MARVKRGIVVKRKHKKMLSMAKGYRGSRSKIYRRAHEAVLHAGEYAFAGRKLKKRDFRALWITHISQAAKLNNISYSKFMDLLREKNIALNRKMLNELVVNDNNSFKKLVQIVKA
ncbi:50S ribosomal protein L20 [Candidatus Gottesmanbacteria bacterium]|nr:50S ribosomal protein L20 [Candidatus Gottesmanbacteria bacterium]